MMRLPLLLALFLLAGTASATPRWHEATVTIAAPMTQILAALETPCQVLQWMPDLSHVETLETAANGESLVYMTSRTPWPFRPRDAVLLFQRQSAADGVRIEMTAQPAARPERPGYVRIPFSEAIWSLQSRNDITLVTYRSRLIPGGGIPQWLSEQFASRRIGDALEALKRHVLETDPAHLSGQCAGPAGRHDPGTDR